MGRLNGATLRVGTEVFICSKWVDSTEHHQKPYMFFGILHHKHDNCYSGIILYDPNVGVCRAAPILYVGKGRNGKAFPETEMEVKGANPMIYSTLISLRSGRKQLEAIMITKAS